MLKRPPPSTPEAPSTRLMSQSMPASKASTLAPLTVIAVVLELEDLDLLRHVGEEDLAGAR